MFMRWIWRGLALWLARKAWDAFQRHQAAQRSPAQRSPAQRSPAPRSPYPPAPPAARR